MTINNMVERGGSVAGRALVLVQMASLTLSGCGVFLVRGPSSSRPPTQEPSCTNDMGVVKRDAGLVATGLLAIALGGLLIESGGSNESKGGAIVLTGAGMMAAGYLSGYIGYRRVKACKSAHKDYQLRKQPATPPTATPPTATTPTATPPTATPPTATTPTATPPTATTPTATPPR